MRILFVFFLWSAACCAQCSVSVTAPSNNTTVTYNTIINATATSCPSAVRFEFRVNGHRFWGPGQEASSYAIPTCSGNTCTGSTVYNFSFLLDGTHQLTALALDSSGTVLATSAGVNVVTDDRRLASVPGNGLALTAPDLSQTQSGTITITVTPSITTSRNAPIAGYIASLPEFKCYIDGFRIYNGGGSLTGAQTFSFDTTTVANGVHDFQCNTRTWDTNSNNISAQPVVMIERQLTTANGSANRELRLTYSTSYLWLGGTASVTVTPRIVKTDDSESAATATFTSDTPSVASVSSCANVSSCTIVGHADGQALIIATAGALSRVVRVVVRNGTPIAPHFGFDGSILTTYDPSKSILARGFFATGFGIAVDLAKTAAALRTVGANEFEADPYQDPTQVNYPNLANWKIFENNIINAINAGLAATGFRSILAVFGSFSENGQEMQSMADFEMPDRIAYLLDDSRLGGKIIAGERGDEFHMPRPRIPGNGVIGAVNGPSDVTASGGTCTVNWPFLVSEGLGRISPYPVTLGNSTNSCLNHGDITPNGPSMTYACSCANGVYKPSGGNFIETGFTVEVLNGMCGTGSGCQNYAPLLIKTPNTVNQSLRAYLQTVNHPVAQAFPLIGAASAGNYPPFVGVYDGLRVADYGSCYWAGSYDEFPSSHTVRTALTTLENKFWTGCWPPMEHDRPISMLVQHGGPWMQFGGKSFALGATSGSNFTTTTTLDYGRVGSKIAVSGSSCNGNYDVTAINGNTMTVSQSPGCTGSGGTVLVGSGTAMFDPPYDMLHNDGGDWRGVGVAAQFWGSIGLPNVTVQRAYTWQWLFPISQYAGYPHTFAEQYNCGACGEAGQTAFSYLNLPGFVERFRATQLSWTLGRRLEPQILQPSCHAPDLGPRIHTWAKCGAAGTLVGAVSDYEAPNTLVFPASLWALYNSGAGAITRYQESLAAYVLVTNLNATATSDLVNLQGPDVVLWYFPNTNVPLAQSTTIAFKPSSVGATRIAFRYSYICDTTDPNHPISNLDQQPGQIVFGTQTSATLDKNLGKICYDYQYLDNSNIPVGARSSIQVLR